MILRSTGNDMVNLPKKYWEKIGWKLNDNIEIKYKGNSIILENKERKNG